MIDHSIGPVWEANHVWLIFCFVVLWTGFSEAYASITLTLFVPLTLAAFGIVLRGSSFAFRKTVFRTRDRRNFGAAFALSSVLVPYCFGAVAGAIASGRVPAGGEAGDPWTSWVNPTSVLGGVLAVVVVAYLAAVYLVWDSRRLGDQAMVEYFRRRAVGAAIAAGVVAFVGIFVLRSDARYLFDELTTKALPLVILSALCGTASLVLLARNAERGARLLAIGAVASIVVGWGVAQWPYILPESLEGRGRRGAVGHAHRPARRHRRRRAHRATGLHPALRPRPEEPAPRRGRRLTPPRRAPAACLHAPGAGRVGGAAAHRHPRRAAPDRRWANRGGHGADHRRDRRRRRRLRARVAAGERPRRGRRHALAHNSIQPLGWRRRRRALGRDNAAVWAEVTGRAAEHARTALLYLLFMAAAGVVAGVGVLDGSSILVVGAMALSPDLLPISAGAVGLVERRLDARRHAPRSHWSSASAPPH